MIAMFCKSASRRTTSEPVVPGFLEPSADMARLVNFLSKDDSIKSLLHWVVSGLDELDEQSRQAERTCLAKARGETDTYPIFGGSTSSESGAETSVEPLEPAKVAEDNLAAAQEGSEGGDTDLSAGNMGMLSSAAPQEGEEDVVRRARSAWSLHSTHLV